MCAALLGSRIQVVGPTGAGKSTVGHHLAAKLGLAFIDLDAVHWKANWGNTPRDEFQARMRALLDDAESIRQNDPPRRAGWVVAGNYFTSGGLTVIGRADTVVWLNLPFLSTYPRLVFRTFHRAWTKEELWPGNPNRESWRILLSKESMLRYGITGRRRQTEHLLAALATLPPAAQVINLRSARQVAAFRRSVDAGAAK